MTEYNKLSEVSYNPKVRAWRFRVKMHRIYPFYSYVTNSGHLYTYVIADEDVVRVIVIQKTLIEDAEKLRQVKAVLEEGGNFSEIYRKVQLKPLKWDGEGKE
ncbi:hypothetical protein YC2023_072521 [Brassica napus]